MARQRTLLTDRPYYGIDALRLRDGAGRLLMRVAALAPDRARISTQHVKHDFGLDTVDGQALVREFVAQGVLHQKPGPGGDYAVTERIAEIAAARVVEPLTRTRARAVVARAAELAAWINSDAQRNPLAIGALAAFGSYMSLDEALAELDLAVVVRRRAVSGWLRRLRMVSRVDGAAEIRTGFHGLSSFVRVHVVTELDAVPRPFAVVYRDG